MSLFYLTNFDFLSIEVDVVMESESESDDELEETRDLEEVRFSIRN
jgi:hypothetical protein